MESIPKIRDAIGKIGTEFESVAAFKGLPEEPDWNEYRKWYANKTVLSQIKEQRFNLQGGKR